MEINIYVSNLGAYNAGTLTGKWTALPVDDVKEIYKDDFKEFGGVDGYGEEYFISDYEAPFKIDELDDLETLNELAEKLEPFDDLEDVYNSLNCPSDLIDQPVPLEGEETVNDFLEGYTPADIISNLDHFSWNDDYIRITSLGRIETITAQQWKDELKDNSKEIIDQFCDENNINYVVSY